MHNKRILLTMKKTLRVLKHLKSKQQNNLKMYS